MRENERAYVAGLIDGEGCIHVEKTKGTYRPRVTVGMSEVALPLLSSMKAEWGGTLYLLRPATDKWAAAWTWYLSGPKAKAILLEIRPFLRLKREQADIAIRMEEVRESLPPRWPGKPESQGLWTVEARDKCEQMKLRIHQLNAKGPGSAASAEVA